MSFRTLQILKIIAAALVLLLACVYLLGFVKSALAGFVLIGLLGGTVGVMIRNGNLPAVCDLCGASGCFSAEYDPGFSNVRLILTCASCGRLINSASGGVRPER